MAWCRWSTDSFSCDFYAYESDTGHELHVAGRRLIWDEPFPLPSAGELVGADDTQTADWARRYRQWMDARETATEAADDKPPGASDRPYWLHHRSVESRRCYAGQSFTFDTPGELVRFARRLETAGFEGPSYGFDGYC